MAAKTPFRVPQSDYPGYQKFFARAAGIFGVGCRPTHLRPQAEATSGEARVTIRLDRNRKPRQKSLWHPGYKATPAAGTFSASRGSLNSSPEFQGRTTFLQSMNDLFYELFHSKNGQLKCPNTKLLSLLVTADEDCRLIFSIWWINRADQQSDQHETEI